MTFYTVSIALRLIAFYVFISGLPLMSKSYRLLVKEKKLIVPNTIVVKSTYEEFALPQTLLERAITTNAHLNTTNTTYFNLSFLRNTPAVRSFIRTQEKGTPFTLEVPFEIHGTFFNRTSKHLVIITGGFTNAHEYMAPFLKIFPNYDLVFFDLPGHGLDCPSATSYKGQLAQYILGVDVTSVTLGPKEVQVIKEVTNYFKTRAYYKTVSGIARCYSSPFFAQAAYEWETAHAHPLFDKLIIDSPFPSFAHFVPNFPALFCSRSNAPLLKHMSQSWLIKQGFTTLAEFFFVRPFSDCLPLAYYLKQLKNTDLLFIHSLQDVAISLNDFNEIWCELEHVENKVVLFTHNKHAMNHIKQKELYKYVGEQFIERPFSEFVGSLRQS